MAITLYTQDQRLAPVTGAKVQAPSSSGGEQVGQSIAQAGQALAGFAKVKDLFEARVDEAGVMELDTQFSNDARAIEQSYLTTQGRNAIDSRPKADEEWEKLAQDYAGRASNDRQRMMLNGALRARRERWALQGDNHFTRETEVWQVGAETASLATLSRDVATLPVNSEERALGIMNLGARLDDVSARRGWSREERANQGFAIFSGVHVATVQQLRDESPEGALTYLEQHEDQIDPDKLPTLMAQVRDDAFTFRADAAARAFIDGEPEAEAVETSVAGRTERLEVIAPVSAAMGSRFGPRRPPGGVGSSNHRGVDYPVPPRTPVVASLPGTVRLRNDPDGYGRYVEIDHGNGTSTRYAHLSAYNVTDGQQVTQGQTIALSGGAAGSDGAGNSQGPHLHYEFRRNGQAVDPASVVGTQQAATTGARAAGGAQFRTEDDVLEWADEQAAGDPRLRSYYERAGMAALSRRRGARSDRESESERAANEWIAQNPGTPWSQAPASIRSSVSPAFRARETQQEFNAGKADRTAAEAMQSATIFLALKDEAVTAPDTFRQRNLDEFRGILTAEQYASIRGDARDLSNDQLRDSLSGVQGVVQQYARQAGIQTGERATPEDAENLAALNLYVSDAARQYQARTGSAPDQATLAGFVRRGLTTTRVDGERRPLAVVGVGAGQGQVVVPRGDRNRIVREFRAAGVTNPTEEQIVRAYTVAVQQGDVVLRGRRF